MKAVNEIAIAMKQVAQRFTHFPNDPLVLLPKTRWQRVLAARSEPQLLGERVDAQQTRSQLLLGARGSTAGSANGARTPWMPSA